MRTAVVLLAAGLGTRMKSVTPKVLHGILGKPMILRIIESLRKLRPERVLAVVNPSHPAVRELLSAQGVETALQRRIAGTAGAVRAGLPVLSGFDGTVLVLNGDTPLVSPETLRKFLRRHERTSSDLSVLSFTASNPFSYGRIFRDDSGRALRIVEEKDLDRSQKALDEVNAGVYALGSRAAALVDRIRMNPKKREYYLTDVLELAVRRGLRCEVFRIGSETEFQGVNTMADLAKVESILRDEVISRLMGSGVRFFDPGSVIVHPEARIGRDTVVYPNVCIEGRTAVGQGAIISPGVRIVDSLLGKGVAVLDNTLIENSRIGDHSVIGPCAHLRPHSIVGRGVKIGNFVEIKKSTLSDGVKASHLSYIGDASVGRDVNIGAGTITCNYDGAHKHRTVLGDGVFVGSDTQFVAPVEIGRNAYIAAGSTITRDVAPFSLALSRTDQVEISGWVKKRKRKKAKGG